MIIELIDNWGEGVMINEFNKWRWKIDIKIFKGYIKLFRYYFISRGSCWKDLGGI